MKLKLKEKDLPPVQLRLLVPATLKERLDQYTAFLREGSGREVEAREMAVEILAQFIESDRDFRQWQKHDQKLPQDRALRKVQRGGQGNGQAMS